MRNVERYLRGIALASASRVRENSVSTRDTMASASRVRENSVFFAGCHERARVGFGRISFFLRSLPQASASKIRENFGHRGHKSPRCSK